MASENKDTDTAAEDISATILKRLNGFIWRCLADADYKAIYVSPSVERMTGYSAQEFMRENGVALAAIVAPEDVDHLISVVTKALENRQPWTCDYRIITRVRKTIWANESGEGVFLPDGSLAFLEGITLAADDRKSVEIKNAELMDSIGTASGVIVARTGEVFALLKQLRLLAFNARLEAIHAGSFGSGFAVVSEEMKQLADETGKLAKAIGDATETLTQIMKNAAPAHMRFK